MKKGFVLYLDQYKPIKNLTQEQKGDLLDAIFKYNQDNASVTLNDPVLEMAFSFFKQAFDRDHDKYLKKCAKNKLNARKRWDANGCGRIQPDAMDADIDTDKGKDIDKDITAEEFEKFWNLYGKKEDRKKCLTKWKNLKVKEKELIFKTVSNYVASTPDKQFRKNPLTWLNGECWNNEIENKTSNSTDISTESWF